MQCIFAVPLRNPVPDNDFAHIQSVSTNVYASLAEVRMIAAEEGRLPRPVPFLVMQPNGKDVACAYVVEDHDEKEKPSTPADQARGVTIAPGPGNACELLHHMQEAIPQWMYYMSTRICNRSCHELFDRSCHKSN